MKFRRRRLAVVLMTVISLAIILHQAVNLSEISSSATRDVLPPKAETALRVLEQLSVKDKMLKIDYNRMRFGNGWTSNKGCDTRNIILNRDLNKVVIGENCVVQSGILNDPYTGQIIYFTRGSNTSSKIQIDHVVALNNAWQTGAYQFGYEKRIELTNDPLNLLAVNGAANQQKSDSDASEWLPTNKPFRCQYVARQITIKQKYNLWVTRLEKQAINKVLQTCPSQTLTYTN
jgi:hypothetical protein